MSDVAEIAKGLSETSVEILSLGYMTPPVECTTTRWAEIFRPFDARARNHAAILAAHNWDVLLIGGRVFLYQPRYGGDLGHWLGHDFTREDATAKQMKALYGRSSDGSVRRRFCDTKTETHP